MGRPILESTKQNSAKLFQNQDIATMASSAGLLMVAKSWSVFQLVNTSESASAMVFGKEDTAFMESDASSIMLKSNGKIQST